MTNLPSGTVAFLSTNFEGLTPRWDIFPNAMTVVLSKHDAIISGSRKRSNDLSHSGKKRLKSLLQLSLREVLNIIKTTGDGFHARFERAIVGARAATNARQKFQKSFEELKIKAHIGLHTGEIGEDK